MELKDLIGEHTLDAVDFSNEQVKTWGDEFEQCEAIRFRLDGKVYIAVEDPQDGYRSCMGELTVGDYPMSNTFAPVRVLGRYRTKDEYDTEDEVLELLDAMTGKVVIEVGTCNMDDYYPYFVANFYPKAMHTNAQM